MTRTSDLHSLSAHEPSCYRAERVELLHVEGLLLNDAHVVVELKEGVVQPLVARHQAVVDPRDAENAELNTARRRGDHAHRRLAIVLLLVAVGLDRVAVGERAAKLIEAGRRTGCGRSW